MRASHLVGKMSALILNILFEVEITIGVENVSSNINLFLYFFVEIKVYYFSSE